VANGDWRNKNFLEGSASALPKNFSAHQEMRPSVFQPDLAWLRFRSHRLQSVDKRGARLPPSQNGSEWRLASSDWLNGGE
jgi:hypothetical protein